MQKQKRERKGRQGFIASEMLANLLDQKKLGIPLTPPSFSSYHQLFYTRLKPVEALKIIDCN